MHVHLPMWMQLPLEARRLQMEVACGCEQPYIGVEKGAFFLLKISNIKRNSIQYILITHSSSSITDAHLSSSFDSSLFHVTWKICVIMYISLFRSLLSQSIKMFKLKVLFLCISHHWCGFSANKCFYYHWKDILKQLVLSTVVCF